jgi:hypothetical protein
MTLKQQALADLDQARLGMVQHWHAAADEIRPVNLVQQSIRKHRIGWAVAAAVAGFIAVRTFLPSSRRNKNGRDSQPRSAKTSGLIALIASPLLGLARQAVMSNLTKYLQQFVQSAVKAQRPTNAPEL